MAGLTTSPVYQFYTATFFIAFITAHDPIQIFQQASQLQNYLQTISGEHVELTKQTYLIEQLSDDILLFHV